MGDDPTAPDDYEFHIEYFTGWMKMVQAVKNRSYDTRYSELRKVDEWARENDIDTIQEFTYTDIKMFCLEQQQTYADKTVEGKLYALKKCLDEALRDGEIQDHPLIGQTAKFSELLEDWGLNSGKTLREKLLAKHDLTDGLTEEEYRTLREDVQPPKNRNQAIVDLMFFTGCRASECAKLKLEDFDFDNRIVTLPDRKKKDEDATRKSKYSPECDLSLAAWMAERDRFTCLVEADEDWMFCSRKNAPITGNRIGGMVIESAKRAGIQQVIGEDAAGNNIYYANSHSLRKGHGSWAIDSVGIYRVQEQLGHTDVDVTEQTYVHTDSYDEDNPYHDLYEGDSEDGDE